MPLPKAQQSAAAVSCRDACSEKNRVKESETGERDKGRERRGRERGRERERDKGRERARKCKRESKMRDTSQLGESTAPGRSGLIVERKSKREALENKIKAVDKKVSQYSDSSSQRIR